MSMSPTFQKVIWYPYLFCNKKSSKIVNSEKNYNLSLNKNHKSIIALNIIIRIEWKTMHSVTL